MSYLLYHNARRTVLACPRFKALKVSGRQSTDIAGWNPAVLGSLSIAMIETLQRVDSLLIIKANEMHYFSYLFDKVLYMFRTSLLSIIRSISTLYTRNMYLSW